MLFWLTGVAFAGDGQLLLRWNKSLGTVRLEAPAGEHLAPEAPTRLSVETSVGHYLVDWGDLAAGIAVPVGSGGPVSGSVSYSLCEDGGTACRVVDVAFDANVHGRKGQQVLSAREPASAPALEDRPGSSPESLTVDEAFALAASTGKPLMLDFGAHWCPPCQVLAAEVLDDPANAGDLDPFVVVEIDADHPGSWEIKDRYGVGGYPTVLVASPEGAEIGRHVGYSTESEFLGWLSLQQGASLEDRLAESSALDDLGKGVLALALMAADRHDDVRALIEGVQGLDADLVRFQLDPQSAAVAGLIDRAGDRWNDWIWAAVRLPLEEETQADLRGLLAGQSVGALPGDAAALAYLAGELAADPADGRTFSALGAQLVASQQSGDPTHDRGFWLDEASFLESAGQVDAAVAVLRQGQQVWPREFTWPYAIAGYLQRADRPEEALPYAQAASTLGYGDQALRAARREAELLEALDRREEALALVSRVLTASERPAEGVQVRTFRYLAALESLQDELTSP